MTTKGLQPVEYLAGGEHSYVMECDTFMNLGVAFGLPEEEHAYTPTLEAFVTLDEKNADLDIIISGVETYAGHLEESLPIFQWLLSPHDDSIVGARIFNFESQTPRKLEDAYWVIHCNTGWEVKDIKFAVSEESRLLSSNRGV